MVKIHKIKVRQDHLCEACNGIILEGYYAFTIIIFKNRQYPERQYFHSNDITIDEFKTMSYNDIRAKICIPIIEKHMSENGQLSDKSGNPGPVPDIKKGDENE